MEFWWGSGGVRVELWWTWSCDGVVVEFWWSYGGVMMELWWTWSCDGVMVDMEL